MTGHGAANLYIGPEEQGYIRILQDYTADVDADVVRFSLAPRDSYVRAYGLKSPRTILGYFHHFADHDQAVSTTIALDIPGGWTVTWLNPATGNVLESFRIASGTRVLTTPHFVVNLALKIEFDSTVGDQ